MAHEIIRGSLIEGFLLNEDVEAKVLAHHLGCSQYQALHPVRVAHTSLPLEATCFFTSDGHAHMLSKQRS